MHLLLFCIPPASVPSISTLYPLPNEQLENILLNSAGEIKLADFGLSIDLNREHAVTRVGTLEYMSPEVGLCPFKRLPSDNKDNSSLHYGTAADIWTIGVLTFELLVGETPFNFLESRSAGDKDLRGSEAAKMPIYPPVFPRSLSGACAAFCMSALQVHAEDRPTALGLLQDPWLAAHGATQSSALGARMATGAVQAPRPSLSSSTPSSSRAVAQRGTSTSLQEQGPTTSRPMTTSRTKTSGSTPSAIGSSSSDAERVQAALHLQHSRAPPQLPPTVEEPTPFASVHQARLLIAMQLSATTSLREISSHRSSPRHQGPAIAKSNSLNADSRLGEADA